MKHPIKIALYLLLIATCSPSFGQMEKYGYKRELKGISEQWHKVVLPKELFGKTSHNLSDIRVFGLTTGNDTIEAPYLLQLTKGKTVLKDVAFKTINASHNGMGHYFTFEIPSEEPINEMKLDFSQKNFDWLIKLEGSQDQNEWFTVVENYRILSIKNDLTDFHFTKLTFPSSRYRFFRVFIDTKEKPRLNSAGISQKETDESTFEEYSIKKLTTKLNKQTKQTEIDVELQLPVRLSHLKIDVSDTFDYYRPVTIKYLADSIKTEQGWKYNYHPLTSATLNSIEQNEFQLYGKTIQKLKILINNGDNQPLTIDRIQAKGYVHQLITRFTNEATYYLTYGDQKTTRPNYDIVQFTDNIPETLTVLELGEELAIKKQAVIPKNPLFKNKSWLWGIMLVIIALLGWFSIKMIKQK